MSLSSGKGRLNGWGRCQIPFNNLSNLVWTVPLAITGKVVGTGAIITFTGDNGSETAIFFNKESA